MPKPVKKGRHGGERPPKAVVDGVDPVEEEARHIGGMPADQYRERMRINRRQLDFNSDTERTKQYLAFIRKDPEACKRLGVKPMGRKGSMYSDERVKNALILMSNARVPYGHVEALVTHKRMTPDNIGIVSNLITVHKPQMVLDMISHEVATPERLEAILAHANKHNPAETLKELKKGGKIFVD